jgi:phenylacetate-CoA ligase
MPESERFDRRRALSRMLVHAATHGPYYKDQQWASLLRAGAPLAFRDIPITPKSIVRERTDQFFCTEFPARHGSVKVLATSGSTGEPMEIRKTNLHFHINAQENLRLKQGWGYHGHARVAEISRPNDEHPIGTIEHEDSEGGGQKWKLYTGEPDAVFELLRETAATLVFASPSLILGALQRAEERSQTLPLRLVSTVQEIVPEALLEAVQRMPGCRLVDVYGSTESGVIAITCSQCGAYHPADRHLIFELITEEGRRAGPGEIGRVVVTPLFNRAMPLVRYEIGDYAMRAEFNECARSRLALKRILGRESNLFKTADGRKVVPRLPHRVAVKLALRQFKLVQVTLTDVELRYIPRAEGQQINDEIAQDMVDRYMAPGFKVRCVPVGELPRAPNGKYLMHESFV